MENKQTRFKDSINSAIMAAIASVLLDGDSTRDDVIKFVTKVNTYQLNTILSKVVIDELIVFAESDELSKFGMDNILNFNNMFYNALIVEFDGKENIDNLLNEFIEANNDINKSLLANISDTDDREKSPTDALIILISINFEKIIKSFG